MTSKVRGGKKKRFVLGRGYTRYRLWSEDFDRAEHIRLYADVDRTTLVPLKPQPYDRETKFKLVLEEI